MQVAVEIDEPIKKRADRDKAGSLADLVKMAVALHLH
jgi:hypothetical protein